jgi:5'-methylthioadenosine phosphorylase
MVEDRRVAFLPRHGTRHQHPPHRVPYRANVSAMRQLGVRALLAPCAAGSLQPTIHPGHVVVLDQLVDRTWGRPETFHDSFEDGPVHISLADPYDPELRARLVDTARAQGLVVHDGGTVVVVNGPRFSTRAESSAYRQAGWHVINMTQHPEAALAREAGIPYAGIALVTDHDAGLDGIDGIEPVTQEEVFAVFEANLASSARCSSQWSPGSDRAGDGHGHHRRPGAGGARRITVPRRVGRRRSVRVDLVARGVLGRHRPPVLPRCPR